MAERKRKKEKTIVRRIKKNLSSNLHMDESGSNAHHDDDIYIYF